MLSNSNLTFASVRAPADKLVQVSARLTVNVILTQVISVEVRPTTKWNDVDVDVDSDTASSCVAVVKALLDRTRAHVARAAECRLVTPCDPRQLTTVLVCTTIERLTYRNCN